MHRILSLSLCLVLFGAVASAQAEFRAGAAVVDVTPDQLPVLVNGGMTSRSIDKIHTPLNARAIALQQGSETVVIVVVDSCMMSREMLDDAKKLASDATGVRPDHLLFSATHAHSAAASMGCLGTDADPNYVPLLRARLVEAVQSALKNLEPAQIGFGVVNAADYTALRRWIRRPDRIALDPFGNATLRANMHAGRNLDDVVGESGPKDPDLTLISLRSASGRPLAVLANFSMHYFGDRDISADYYGLFSDGLKQKISPETADGQAPFVGIMSHGCSGDIWKMDYTDPTAAKNHRSLDEYTQGLLDLALSAYQKIQYRSDAELSMAETRLPMNYRVPDQQRLEWARRIVAEMGDRLPKTVEEVYAREQILLDEMKSTEVVVQAIRIGDIAIATTPTETYAITGLKIKQQSPFEKTMVIELANGGDGYIPPPEQHLLGGYNTWPARSAGLEVTAEPRIVAAALELLEQVTKAPRRKAVASVGPAAQAIVDLKPDAWFRLDEFSGPRAVDSSGHRNHGIFEPRVAYYLEGPQSASFCLNGETNRAVHFAGERLRVQLPEIGTEYTVSLWFWNGMPGNGRDVAGWLWSRGQDQTRGMSGDHLGIGGTSGNENRLIFQQGSNGEQIAGKTEIGRWTWNQVVFVRKGDTIRVHLNGNPEPEFEATTSIHGLAELNELFFGGRCDHAFNWEGRLDEIAVFNRALSAEELTRLKTPAAP